MQAPFKKARNKFLILNLSITTVIMLAAFFSIYTIFELTLQRENREILDHLILGDDSNGPQHLLFGQHFSALLDEDGNILSMSMMNEEVVDFNQLLTPLENGWDWLFREANYYIELVQEAWSGPMEETIHLDNSTWMVRTVPLENQYRFEFLDTTATTNTMASLLSTFFFTGGISFFIIFIFSTLYANRTMKPIVTMWDAQKSFIINASHELKTPLSTIISSSDVLQMTPEETIGSGKMWFDGINLGTARMTKLINSLLTLTKFEELNVPMEKSDVNASVLLWQAINLIEVHAAKKKIQFIKEVDDNIYFKGGEQLILTIFEAILENGIKYANTEGTVTVSLKQQGKQHAVYTVSNTGPGIPKEHLTRVFDRFYRGDTSRASETGDFGLGLSLVKAAVNQLNGKIQVASEVGKITTFTVVLKK